jgi:CHAT domain-containing protein/Tfp pilus assembly protein PilF
MQNYTLADLDTLETRQERFSREGNFEEALNVAQQILKVVEDYYSPFHPRLATCYNNISYFQRSLCQFSEAETNCLEAIKIIRRNEGTDNHELSIPLSNLGMVCEELGRYEEAEQHMAKALKLILAEYGPARFEVPLLLNNLGIVLARQGKHEEAEMRYNSAINNWKSLKGGDCPEIAFPLSNLGDLYLNQGRYPEAETVIRKGLEIREKTAPEGDHSLAPIYENLGRLYYEKGEYQESLDFNNKALGIRRRVLGDQHAHTAQSIVHIAMSLKILGCYHEAIPMYQEAIEIYEKVYPPGHPYIATVKNNLALAYEAIGDYQQTESALVQALENKIRALGPDHYELVTYYINLANLYIRKKEYQQAMDLCRKAENLLNRHMESDNRKWLNLYNTIALIYTNQGKYSDAEKHYKKCIKRYEDSALPDPDSLASVWNNLACLYQDDENYTRAEECLKRSIRILEDGISPQHPGLIHPLLRLAVVRTFRRNYPSAMAIFRRIAMLQQRYIEMVFSFTDEEEKLEFIDFISTPYLITLSAIFTHMSRENPKAVTFAYETVLWRKGIVLNSEIRNNKALQQQVQGLQQKASAQDIINALPERTALLEFVKIQDYDVSFSKNPWGISRYIVFILRHNGCVRMVDLGNAATIDPCVGETLGAIRAKHHKIKELLQELNTYVIAPLEGYIKGIDRLIICPDGLISLIPFSAIIDSSGDYLVKRFTITHVTGSREILPTPKRGFDGRHQLVLAADPLFNHPDAKKNGMKRALKQFKPLKGTQEESIKIPPLVPGEIKTKRILTGLEATKEAILNVSNPRILHLATHGDFLSKNIEAIISAPMTPTEIFEGLIPSINKRYGPNSGQPPEAVQGTQPLSQSYLALAGANHVNPQTGETDGLLTGLEIAGMQLQGTQLVVLSACNTGLGDIMLGEGVSGLRRAFALTGAKNLVLSLWPVSDHVTTVLMETFYRNLRQMPPAEALRQAQLQTIMELEKQMYGPMPFFWAPFIIQGGQALTTSIYDTPVDGFKNGT